jgi:hypothetical protein
MRAYSVGLAKFEDALLGNAAEKCIAYVNACNKTSGLLKMKKIKGN